MPRYAELHCHTDFSFLDGASPADDLIEHAAQLGLASVAVTDHQGLYGVVRFASAAEEAGIHALIGLEMELLDSAVPDPQAIVVPARRPSRQRRGAQPPFAGDPGLLFDSVGTSRDLQPPADLVEGGRPVRPRATRARLPGHREPLREDLRGIADGQRGPHLVLLARDAVGYRSLCRLVSGAQMAGTKGVPRFTHGLLGRHTEGLVALSGCRHGEVARRLLAGDRTGAQSVAEGYARLFGHGGFFLELQHHLLPDDDWLVAETARLAGELGLPVVVTNDAHYALPEDRELQDVLVAIRHGLTLDESAHLRRPNGEYHLKGADGMLGLPPAEPDAPQLVRRAWAEGMATAVELAERCRVDLGFERYRFPGFQVPKGETPFSHLVALCQEGARRRYHPLTPPVVRQLAHELDVIERTGLAEFFLICWDLMHFARERGIPAQGRGSAGDSIVAYVLGITRVDPIRHHLLFERFINEGRTTYPDVDIDFASSRREEVLQYVYERYGPEHTGMVCNIVTYRARSAVREVGYALGFPRPLVDRVAKALETYDSVMVRRDLEAEGGFGQFFAETVEREAEVSGAAGGMAATGGATGDTAARVAGERGLTDRMGQLNRPRYKEETERSAASVADLGGGSATEQQRRLARRRAGRSDDEGGPGDSPASVAWLAGESGTAAPSGPRGSTAEMPDWERWLTFCARIDGFPRHLSIHTGGMLVTAAPLIDIAPLERATMPGRVVVQFDKRDVETLKLIKLDLLGLGMLAAIDETLGLIEHDCAVCVDLDRLPEDVPEVFEMLQAADTVGVFQVESRAQMQTLPKSKPANLDDLVVEVAIIRPGPIQGNAVHPYLRRRQGLEPTTYLHPSLEPVLHETLGVILYQEQVMQIAISVAGFSAAESDRFRRAMGTWRSSREMEKLHQRFGDGCKATNGLTDEQAEELFRQVAAFASFGFAKSHAAAFARTAYESAFLKLFYPAHFTVGLINAQPMGFYPVEVLINDAKRHGVAVLPVDMNASTYKTTTEWVGRDDVPLPEGAGIRRRPVAVRSSGCIVPAAESRRRWTPDDATGYGIRLGLALVKGIGEEHAERLDSELARGSYHSLADVVARTELPEEVIERLIRAGALGSLGRPRRELLWQLREVMGATRGRMVARGRPTDGRAKGRKARSTGRASARFGRAAGRPMDLRLPPTPAPELPALTERERLGDSYAVLSLDASRQVVSLFRPALDRLGAVTNASLADRGPGPVRLGGLVVTRQHPMTARGTVFLALEDETGMVNVTLWPEAWARLRGVVRRHALLYVEGMLQREANVVNVVARRIEPLPAVAESVGGPARLEGVRALGYSGPGRDPARR